LYKVLKHLTDREKEEMNNIGEELNRIWSVKEIKARQMEREREIKEGDRNTRYFQAVANQRRRKNNVHCMEGPEETVQSTEEIVEVATNYYNELFKFEPRPNINISSDFFTENDKVTLEEVEILETPFFEEEIKKAVFGSYSDGAPGLDGLSFMFYQEFWSVVKQDILEMFEDFHKDKLDIYRLNFSLVTIIPRRKMLG
jgi:hypothetical protein